MTYLYHLAEAKQHPDMRRYDLCFGGRRQFCGNSYADLGL